MKVFENSKVANQKITLNSSRFELIIVLDRIDRVLKSKREQLFLLDFLSKIYDSLSSFNIKIVFTYLIEVTAYPSLIAPIQELFKEHANLIKLFRFKETAAPKSVDTEQPFSNALVLNEIKEKLNCLFKRNNLQNIIDSKLVEVLIHLLKLSRFGLKQSELLHLLGIMSTKCVCPAVAQLVWFTFKYYSHFLNQVNLIESAVSNNQVLYRLGKSNTFDSLKEFKKSRRESNDMETQIIQLVNLYYKSIIDKSMCDDRQPVAMLLPRAYDELPLFDYYVNCVSSEANPEARVLHSFIQNQKWLLNKAAHTGNILYYMQDLEMFKELYFAGGSKHKDMCEQFHQFERLFYKILYFLHQDPNQVYFQSKCYLKLFNADTTMSNKLISTFLVEAKNSFKTYAINSPQLIALNYDQLIQNEEQNPYTTESWLLKNEKIAFNTLQKMYTFYSKVFFLSAYIVLALSESHNEIKIWKINSDTNKPKGDQVLELKRTLKFNKSPKDLRLLDKHTAIILIDRNLHVFDLNTCKHVLDMNSTMSANVPYFEIHDRNHVVLLARNRLSVILMKVIIPADMIPPQEESGDQDTAPPAVCTPKAKNYSTDDNMFLFKAGEDRYLNSLLVSDNGQIMVCGDEVQKPFPLLVWNLNQRKLVYDLRQAKHEFITSIQSISSSGRFMVCGCQVGCDFFADSNF